MIKKILGILLLLLAGTAVTGIVVGKLIEDVSKMIYFWFTFDVFAIIICTVCGIFLLINKK